MGVYIKGLEMPTSCATSEVLRGAFSESSIDYDSLSLLVYEGGGHKDLTEQDEEETEDGE